MAYGSKLTRSMFVGLAAAAAIACGTSVAPDEAGTAEQAVAESLADDNAPLLVKDPRTLAVLEERGLALSTLLGVSGTTADAFLASPAYTRISRTVDFDLRMLRAQDPKSGVGVEFPHRQFDPKWLQSPEARFELVAVVNRLDRKHVGGCGELRLIYRLAYTATQSESRLPMTMNVVFPQLDDGEHCSRVAQRWLSAKSGTADALLEGPLAGLPRIGQIEINFQAVRWPSNERPEMGGHAEYILRVFKVTDAGVEATPLENTPRMDLAPAERDELRGWIRDHLGEIDEGTAIIPSKFLATQAVSVGPRGLARTANRAFTQIFSDPNNAFADLPLSGTKQIKSVAALMRRLDTMTCHGCHQARAVAGFHLLGEERDSAARLNALAVGRSPHMSEELTWRTDVLRAVSRAEAIPAPRPFAEHAAATGKYGAHCGLGDAGFEDWTCSAGLRCMNVHGGFVGMCLPELAPVGDVCETVRITPNPDSHRDRVVDHRTLACDQDGKSARCNPVEQGFPDGMCRADCTEAEVGTIAGETICGLVPSASGLTQCLAAHRPFHECLATQNTATFLRTCDATEACRDDYACARVKNGPPGVGACMPPYFAFQARVDGHLFDR
jgi:hypothetical protein